MSPKSENIREALSAYLDGELPEAEARRVEQAVREDAALAAELNRLRSVQGLLRRLPRVGAPAGMLQRVLARMEATVLVGRLRRRANRVAALAVAAGVLVAVGLTAAMVILRPGGAGQKPELARRTAPLPDLGAGDGLYAFERTAAPGPSAAPSAPAVPVNLVINVRRDELAKAQRDLEGVFARNSLLPKALGPEVRQAKSNGNEEALANFYTQIRDAPNEKGYEVVVAEDHLRRLVGDINEIRTRQNVPQIPFGQGEVVLARADARGARGVAAAEPAKGPGVLPATRPARALRPQDESIASSETGLRVEVKDEREGFFGRLWRRTEASRDRARVGQQATEIASKVSGRSPGRAALAPATQPAAAQAPADADRQWEQLIQQVSAQGHVSFMLHEQQRQGGMLGPANLHRLVVILNGLSEREAGAFRNPATQR